jgi:hypothetical protein
MNGHELRAIMTATGLTMNDIMAETGIPFRQQKLFINTEKDVPESVRSMAEEKLEELDQVVTDFIAAADARKPVVRSGVKEMRTMEDFAIVTLLLEGTKPVIKNPAEEVEHHGS